MADFSFLLCPRPNPKWNFSNANLPFFPLSRGSLNETGLESMVNFSVLLEHLEEKKDLRKGWFKAYKKRHLSQN